MSREVRRVPADWKHPKDDMYGRERYTPLHDGADYQRRADSWLKALKKHGLQGALDHEGNPPNKDDYMPIWGEAEKTHLMMYETCSKGTPISPAFKTPEELARWSADNNASAFGSMTATYEQWLHTCREGYAIGAVFTREEGFQSGVAYQANHKKAEVANAQ